MLYRLADDNAQTNPVNNRIFIDAEYNRAFVFTQYAGYLRRETLADFSFGWARSTGPAARRDQTACDGLRLHHGGGIPATIQLRRVTQQSRLFPIIRVRLP